MRYFRELGIPPSQMAAYSEGSKHPVSDNSTEAVSYTHLTLPTSDLV